MATNNLNEEFPLLRKLCVLEGTEQVRGFTVAGIVNTTRECAYTLHSYQHAGQTFELRITGLGDEARFEWITEAGSTVGEAFDTLRVGETHRLVCLISPKACANG